MNYTQADNKLQGRNKDSRKLGNNTYLLRHEDCISVRLHNTDIVKYYPDGSIELNTGGWNTLTTKARINEYAPIRVYQEKGIWYLMPDKTPFVDGMKVDSNGVVIGDIDHSIVNERKELIKKINKYCKAIRKLESIPEPNNGDCWYCLFKDTKNSKPMGEAFNDTQHLINHLDEMYIHGSLIMNALVWRGYRDPWMIVRMNLRDSIVNAVRDYLKRQLGLG